LTLLQTQSVIVDALERDLEAEGRIPLPWVEVLMQVTSAPGGKLSMQELARSVLLSKSGITRLVDRMVEAGLVTREPCPTDRRMIWAVATPAGRTALRRAVPVHTDSLVKNFSTVLTPAELRMLSTTLRKVLDAQGFAPTPCPSGVSVEPEKKGSVRARVGGR
jgi:DNA-binding MarR family transcriptional regulator